MKGRDSKMMKRFAAVLGFASFLVLALLAVPAFAASAETPGTPDWVVILVMTAQIFLPLVFRSSMGPLARKMTPVGNLIISVLTQFWTVWTAASGASTPINPASVALVSASGIVYAGFLSDLGNAVLRALVNSLLQTAIVTGVHSGPKNVGEGVKILLQK